MKAKEIVVGQEYAIERWSGSCYRARVEAIEYVDRRISSRRGFGSHPTTMKMVKAVYLRDDGTEVTANADYVIPAKVQCLWAPYAERQQKQKAQANQLSDALSAVEQRVKDLCGVDVRFARGTAYQNGIHAGFASISASDLEKILNAVQKS